MQLTAVLTLFGGALATAFPAAIYPAPSPASTSTDDDVHPSQPFGIISIRSGAAVHLSSWGAAGGRIGSALTNQNAVCDDGQGVNYATFNMYEGELYLYNSYKEGQRVWVDRSESGPGITGYTANGSTPPPINATTHGFVVDSTNHLTFNGSGFYACPGGSGGGGGWAILAAGDATEPGGEGCVGIAARTQPSTMPKSCVY